MKPAPAVGCDVCGKPTSRLMGFAAVVSIKDGDAKPLTRIRSSARGFCLAHRDAIAPRFLADVEAEGEVLWQAPEPKMLRPSDIQQFHTEMNEMAVGLGEEMGISPERAQIEMNLTAGGHISVPDACPHCGGRLSWDTGPHVRDALERPGFARAWECLDCRAAGMLA